MKDTCVFYRDFRNAARNFQADKRATFYEMVFDYAMDGIEPSPDSEFIAHFELIRTRLDADIAKYNAKSENGKKGGAPKGNQNAKKQPNSSKNKPKQPNSSETSHNINEDDNYVNVNYVNDNNLQRTSRICSDSKQKRFIKPTVKEIADYCRERSNNVDAQIFFDFYESKGWIVGKTPMKDWKAAVRTWEQNADGKPTRQSGSGSPIENNAIPNELRL